MMVGATKKNFGPFEMEGGIPCTSSTSPLPLTKPIDLGERASTGNFSDFRDGST